MNTANDNASPRNPRKGAGRDVRTALATMAQALRDGDLARVRNAARYAVARLFPGRALPTYDVAEIWAVTLQIYTDQADMIDAAAVRYRMANVY
jgi:hypothetical protein